MFALKKFFDFFFLPTVKHIHFAIDSRQFIDIQLDEVFRARFHFDSSYFVDISLDFRTWALFVLQFHLWEFFGLLLFLSLGLSRINKSILSSIFSNRLLMDFCFFLLIAFGHYHKSGCTLFTVVTTIQVGEWTNNDDEDWNRERKYIDQQQTVSDPKKKN